MKTASTRIIDIKPQNRVKSVQKLENGDLFVEQASGNTFTVSKDDQTFQAFVIYSVLAEL